MLLSYNLSGMNTRTLYLIDCVLVDLGHDEKWKLFLGLCYFTVLFQSVS